MKCYLVTAPGATRYAATNALARETKAKLVEELGCKKSEVTIEQTEVPTAKHDLIAHLNEIMVSLDAEEDVAP